MNQALTKRSDFKIFVVNIVYRITTDQRCVSLLVGGNTSSAQLKFTRFKTMSNNTLFITKQL